MGTGDSVGPAVATETWGTWQDAERWSHEAFRARSPQARLAWLEDLLRLRQAAMDASIATPRLRDSE